MKFKKIQQIDLSSKESWSESVFLTFDIDWASDEVLNYSLNILEKYDINATFFVTHDTPVLNRIRENPKFELGIHPNFNFLLNGSYEKGRNFQEVVSHMMDIVPEAKSVRSHSMTQNSYILDAFRNVGLIYDCNHFISVTADIELKPWLLWNGLIRCPYYWEDDVHYIERDKYKVEQLLEKKGLKIFDFHPIHVFLNTEKSDRYEVSRPFHRQFHKLQEFRYEGYATETILLDLIDKCK